MPLAITLGLGSPEHDAEGRAITAEFAHAVYRFGHSMLDETLNRVDANGNPVESVAQIAGLSRERKVLAAIGERWRPWRSVATWYLWRSLDPVPVEY